jgi:sensor histidine kinase YesM
MKRVSLHILFWTLYLAQDTVFAYLAEAITLRHFSTSARIIIALKVCVAYLLPKIILTYFLLYAMLHRIIKQKGNMALNIFYIVFFFGIMMFFYSAISVYFVYPEIYKDTSAHAKFFNGVNFLFSFMDLGFVSGSAIAIKLIFIQLAAKEHEKLLIKDKLETEIKFLKNQTNPHFLFNTLNNIYALARKKSDSTADVVMKLSKILRFMLYETGKRHITIAEEVKLIEDYIDLERLRYNERLNITFKKIISKESQIISPLLLLPFVENAFKHGASETRFTSFIHIELRVYDEQLHFTIENNKDEDKMKEDPIESIGLMNIRRQLELLYGDYEMKVENQKNIFRVILHVNLKSYGKV